MESHPQEHQLWKVPILLKWKFEGPGFEVNVRHMYINYTDMNSIYINAFMK